jgi:hypothetical protein
MKKIIIGLSSIIILALAVILFTNARNENTEVKKAATEVSKDYAKCPSASKCANMTDTKSAACEMTKCKEAKCDPATCKKNCADAKGDMKNCDPAKCPMKSTIKK